MPDVESKTDEKSIVKKPKVKSSNRRMEGLKRFAVETRAEFRKIVWPTRKQTVNQTIVVLVAIVLIGVLIWVLDTATMYGLGTVLKKY
jgi:preprotein translocase subunit SecE